MNILTKYLRELADKIDSGECALTEEEKLDLLSQIAHTKINKTEAADMLHMSTRNFDRKIKDGEIPAGIHERGSKQLIWYKDEILKYETESI